MAFLTEPWTELGHLRMVLLWAKKHQAIPEVPAVERPSKPPPRNRRLTREEVKRLLAACTIPHLKLFVILALATAGRRAALLGLKWDRVDFETDFIDLEDPDIGRPHKGRGLPCR